MGFLSRNKPTVARAETRERNNTPAIAYPDAGKLQKVTDKISSAIKKEFGGGVHIEGTSSGRNRVETNVTINVFFFPEIPDAMVEGFLDRIVEKRSQEDLNMDEEDPYRNWAG